MGTNRRTKGESEEVGSRVSTPDGRERGGREGTKRTDSSAGESTMEVLNEEFSQLCDLHRHERYEVKPATPRWREIEFGNVLGECAPLLFPLIGIMDLLLGVVLYVVLIV